MSENVKSLFGGPTGATEVNDNAIYALEIALEKARAGEVVGVVVAMLHKDRLASWHMGGMVGGYSMLGALEDAKANVLDVVRS